MKATLFILALLLTLACGRDKSKKSSETKQPILPYYSAKFIDLKVFYEEGAEPYTEVLPGVSLWSSILQPNLEALYTGRKIEPVITVPKTLAEMQKFSVMNKTKWSITDVQNLAKTFETKEKVQTKTFLIIFVKGQSEEGAGILGFHISNSRIMVIFKDVIKTMSSSPIVVKYVEQATLVHEMGHAIGLVDNGLPMQTDHKDKDHGAHCVNPECVMFWSNEGQSDMISFIQKFIATQNTVMFGKECLEDSRKY